MSDTTRIAGDEKPVDAQPTVVLPCKLHGYKTRKGYAETLIDGRHYYRHRLVCAETYGLDYDDDSWVARHTCDNPECIEPTHIIPGTRADNIQDAVERGRWAHGENHVQAKLTDAQIMVIRRDARANTVIAAEYNVHPTFIGKIKRGLRR